MTSLSVILSQRRDGTFYLYGEVCRFIHKLCFRCYTPGTAPLENAWFVLLGFKTPEGDYADADEFLIRQKLTSKVNTASKQKAEGIHSGTEASQTTIQKTSETDFVTSALHYFGYLLDEFLRQSGFNSDIVKGLAAFHPLIIFKRPNEITLRHFEALYTTFLLRAWVTSADESAYRYEYLELLDYLRSTYRPDSSLEESSRDLIEILVRLEILQTRARLL